MAKKTGWFCVNEARIPSATGLLRKRLHILLSKGQKDFRFGIDLISHGTQTEIEQHYQDQATIYQNYLQLDRVLIVNFCTSIPKERIDWMFPCSEDEKIQTIHVCIPPLPEDTVAIKDLQDAYCTIMISTDGDQDLKVPLNDNSRKRARDESESLPRPGPTNGDLMKEVKRQLGIEESTTLATALQEAIVELGLEEQCRELSSFKDKVLRVAFELNLL
jgi:hypothetical protein